MPTTPRRRCAVKNIQNLSPATSAAGVRVRECFGNAPTASLQGTGLSFASAYGAPKAAPAQHAMTLSLSDVVRTSGAVRTEDARVPEPRGRQH
jgi:hypothetical protein